MYRRLLFVGLFMHMGCISPGTPAVDAKREQLVLQEGYAACRQGDLQSAMALLRQIDQTAPDSAIQRQTLFGIAGIRLAAAEDVVALEEALAAWENWKQRYGETISGDEDLRCFEPLIQRYAAFVKQSSEAEAQAVSPSVGTSGRSISVQNLLPDPLAVATAKNEALKKTLNRRTQELKTLRANINHLEAENRMLKQQIETMEAIHNATREKMKATDVTP